MSEHSSLVRLISESNLDDWERCLEAELDNFDISNYIFGEIEESDIEAKEDYKK
ncbi:hypothetical protein QBC32DRAFT_319699 [Pseudoneurospora amorphoporcata]|uniref:Uncharacterized protein n=1 Tax=Pseudoneurospora amorphoporcata TaxID=241081 RepID=A0AAN6NJ04_9PEZI|nr:hypothetical protein QBC32DRAFT_319699 [Pseudoneurospora amorphoporcata]